MKNQLGISYNWAVKPHGLVSRGHVVEIHAAVEIFSVTRQTANKGWGGFGPTMKPHRAVCSPGDLKMDYSS